MYRLGVSLSRQAHGCGGARGGVGAQAHICGGWYGTCAMLFMFIISWTKNVVSGTCSIDQWLWALIVDASVTGSIPIMSTDFSYFFFCSLS